MKYHLKTNLTGIFIFVLIFVFITPEILSCRDINFYENRDYNNLPQEYGFANVSAFRNVIDLNGEWEYTKEPESGWEKVFVPSCYDYKGKLFFRKEFEVDSTFIGKYLELFLYGINYRCTIKINNRLIGNHFGGYSAFSFEVPDNIIRIGKKNKIEIEVNNRLDVEETIPITQQVYGWKNYGGIFREIFIVSFPKVFINEVNIAYDFSDSLENCQNNIKITIKNFDKIIPPNKIEKTKTVENIVEIGYGIELYDSFSDKLILKVDSGNELLKIHRSSIAEVSFGIKNVQLWDINNPKLYKLHVYITQNKQKIDEEKITIGYRDIKVKGDDIYINNKKVKLWGIFYQEDYPGLGSALNWNVIEQDIIKIKNLDFNLIQSYYPFHPYFYELCNKHGIFVIVSLPIWNVPAVCFENKKFNELSINYLREIVQKNNRFASVIAWGIGGEIESSDISTVKYVRKIVENLRELDSRPSFFSTRVIENEKCADLVDMPGLNLYVDSPEKMYEKIKSWKLKFPDKPLIISRYGIDFFSLGINESRSASFMDFHAMTLKSLYEKIYSDPDIDMSILWSYSDWRMEKPLNIVPPDLDQYLYLIGLTDYNRNERVSYRVLKALKTEGKDLSIFTGNLKNYEPYEYQIIGFIIIVLLIYQYKRNRKFSGNIKRALFFPKGFFRDVMNERVLSLGQTIFFGILISMIFSVILSSYFYFFKLSKEFDYFISQFIIVDFIKEIIGRLTWSPLSFILYISIVLFLFLLVVSWLVFFWGMFQRFSLPIKSTIHIVFWAGVNNLFLIPIAMILYPALQYKGIVIFSLIITFFFVIWNVVRLMNIISISYHVHVKKVII